MTTSQVVKMSVTVNNNSPIQDYVQLADQTQPTFEMTPGFKPFTKSLQLAFNPLRPNIHKQILQTDLYTFPYRISWEKLIKDQRFFSLWSFD